MKFKSTKFHRLVPCDKEDSFKGAQLLSSYLICPSHSDRAVEVKCDEHNTLCCLTCATITHRNCQSVSEIRQLATGCKTNGRAESLRTRIEEISSCIEEVISASDSCHKEFDHSVTEIPRALEQIKASLMEVYDRTESYVLDKVKDFELTESETTKNCREKWASKLSTNGDLLKMLDAILEVGTDSQAYVTMHRIMEILGEYEQALADQGSHISGQNLQLNITQKLHNILTPETLQSLVNIEAVQTQYQLPKTSAYSETTVQDEVKSTSDSLQEKVVEDGFSFNYANDTNSNDENKDVLPRSFGETETSRKKAERIQFNKAETTLFDQWLGTTGEQGPKQEVTNVAQLNPNLSKTYADPTAPQGSIAIQPLLREGATGDSNIASQEKSVGAYHVNEAITVVQESKAGNNQATAQEKEHKAYTSLESYGNVPDSSHQYSLPPFLNYPAAHGALPEPSKDRQARQYGQYGQKQLPFPSAGFVKEDKRNDKQTRRGHRNLDKKVFY